MNISYKWLKRYIDISLTPAELTSVLTSIGLECDHYHEVESIKGGLKGIKIGKVLTCEDHPNSDHLHITTVDLGDGEPKTIVCGAPNVAAWQTVVVATIGTTLYDGDKEFQIKKSKIRGVESFGMICAEDEIGIGESHDGIMVLPEGVAPGTDASSYFKVESDYVFEVELTPNRIDAASHYGVARDLKAYFATQSFKNGEDKDGMPLDLPSVESFRSDKTTGTIGIKVEDLEGCPRYSGVTIRGVEVKESPEWLRNLLTAIGQRPINNIVDITNFILHGIGQPLHCFDLGKVAGDKIIVKDCSAGTKFRTLDGNERELHEKDLMICDEEKPLCIAGVFGGINSGVTMDTKDVFIESAYFNPTRIRRTARRHALNTDASFRYERGTDPNITVYAAKLAALLIKELAGGEICGDVEDNYPDPVKEVEIDFSLAYCNSLIGKEIPKELVVTILKALEIDVEQNKGNEDLLKLKVPTYRVDVTRPCDVVEEILRIYGYNEVEIKDEMKISISQLGDTDLSYQLQQKVSDRLTGEGFMEIMNNSLTSKAYYEKTSKYPSEKSVKLMNPLSGDLSLLRQTLLFGGLESIAYNINRRSENLRFYEFGNVYSFNPEKEFSAERPLAPYGENLELSLWLTGDFTVQSWDTKQAKATAFDLKGIINGVFTVLGIDVKTLKYVEGSDEIFSEKLEISERRGKKIGELGYIGKEILKDFDISQDVVYAALDWNNIFSMIKNHNVTYTELPKTQPVYRDLALLIDKDVTYASIVDIVRKAGGNLLKNVSLFDVYEGKNLPAGKKSYGISIELQDKEKTLNDKQIDMTMQKIIAGLQKSGVELR